MKETQFRRKKIIYENRLDHSEAKLRSEHDGGNGLPPSGRELPQYASMSSKGDVGAREPVWSAAKTGRRSSALRTQLRQRHVLFFRLNGTAHGQILLLDSCFFLKKVLPVPSTNWVPGIFASSVLGVANFAGWAFNCRRFSQSSSGAWQLVSINSSLCQRFSVRFGCCQLVSVIFWLIRPDFDQIAARSELVPAI